MVDTHSHILPGIDDGSKSLEESVELCRIAAADGVRSIVATPHVMEYRYPNTRESIEASFALLDEAVRTEGIPLQLIKGAEVHVAADIVERLRNGDLLTYNDQGRYLLLEFPFQQIVTGTEEIVYRLRLAGVTPVIAHPERIGFFMDDLARLHRLVTLGALVSITGGSLLGGFGERSERAAWSMVERKLAHIVASDGHDRKHRRPELSGAAEALSARIGGEEARMMCVQRPSALVEGGDIDVEEPEAPASTGWRAALGRFFSRS